MKRPEKIVKWLHVERKPNDPFLDHNGTPLFDYFIELPYWIAKAYHPFYVKVEVRSTPISYADMMKEENKEEVDNYFKENWAKKLTDMRKLNHNYLLVSTKAMAQDGFKSIEDYNSYHKELQELNRKYGLGEKK
jgi:hypothetical protein